MCFFESLIHKVNAFSLYKMGNIQGSSRQIHQKCRLEIVHGLVQPLLNKKSKGELVVAPGRRPNIHATRLQGKHFASSMYPRRGVCRACGYKKRKNGKQIKKRHVTIVQSVKSSFVKNVLKIFAPRVRSGNY